MVLSNQNTFLSMGNTSMEGKDMKKKILIIDDDEVFRYLHAKIVTLSGAGAEIITASHGLEGLEVLTKIIESGGDVPTEIFVDLNMPEMNGFEFIRAFNDFDFPGKCGIRIVIVTSSVNEADRVIAGTLGIKYFLTKPLLVNDVIGLLNMD